MKNQQDNETENRESNSETAPEQNPWSKMLREFAPLIIFFVTYKFTDIYIAAAVFIPVMAVAMMLAKKLDGHIPMMMKVTFVIVLVTGVLTISLGDPRFVYMKPTIVNGFFAFMLALGLARGKSYLKLVMEEGLPPLEDAGWFILTRNWLIFFVLMAVLNEAVWRNFTEETWITFKVWGFIPLTLVFAFAQAPVIMKYSKEKLS